MSRAGADRNQEDEDDRLLRDDRPPICPACGVTNGLALGENGRVVPVCLECGFSEAAATDGWDR